MPSTYTMYTINPTPLQVLCAVSKVSKKILLVMEFKWREIKCQEMMSAVTGNKPK